MEPPPAIRRAGVGAEDRISGLPDDILHIILSRVPSPADAARTSVLSRHWRGVWARMPVPELVFGGDPAPATTPSALLDSIDAALEPPAPPTLRTFKIDVSGVDVPAHRISQWLRFASQRIAGKLHVHLRNDAQVYGENMEELVLPICGRATEIDLSIMGNFVLRPPPTGSFSLLTDLKISYAQVDGSELGRVVSSAQCPRLQKLHLLMVDLVPVCDVSMSSESLQCLHWASDTGKLEVTAPMLHEISVGFAKVQACIVVAPKLEKVVWHDTYDPCRDQFVVTGRHLRSLNVLHSIASSIRLIERFDTIDELEVCLLLLEEGIAGYTTLLQEIEKLPICETLVVNLMRNHHAFSPIVLHLLRRCSYIRKLRLITGSEMSSCTTSNCPCHLLDNYRLDDITFDSLEEIEIFYFTGSAEQLEFVKLLLSRCNPVILAWVSFMTPSDLVSSEIMEAVHSIQSMCHPNNKVHFTMNYREVPKP